MEKIDITPATPDIVWAALRELIESQKETDRQLKELKEMLGGMGNSKEYKYNHLFFRQL